MGFRSLDDYVNKTTNESKTYRVDWNKNALGTTAQVACEWYCLFMGAGNPQVQSLLGTGTNLTAVNLTDTTPNINSLQHGGNIVSGTKHIVNATAFSSAATSCPAVLMLVDLLQYVPVTTVTTTGDQNVIQLTNSPSRYTDGKGVQCFVTPSTVMGAATPNILIEYTNVEGVTGRRTPLVLPVGKTASPVAHISYSGVAAAGKYGPFFPLMDGDKGIRSLDKINLSASYLSGVLNFILCKPLLTIPLTTIGAVRENDFINQIPSLPEVKNGACLAWIMYAGVATPTNSAYYGHIDFAWS